MKFRALICLALTHTLVDGYAQFVTPLWPQLQRNLGISPWTLTAVFAAWQTAASISQPLFGCWSDRFDCRWLVGAGPAVAIVCLSLIGHASGPLSLGMLLVLGGLGIGAFHPEAAVSVAEVAGHRTNLALAVFVFGGMVGLGVGPIVSGTLAEGHGLPSLVWMMLPGLLVLSVLLLLHRPARHAHASNNPAVSLRETMHGRWGSAALLLTVATFRSVPVLGIPLALAFWMKQRQQGEAAIGGMQSLFLLSGSLGTLLGPLFFRTGREVTGMIASTVPAAACMVLLTGEVSIPGVSQPWVQQIGLAGAGFFLQAAIPLLIAYSQRLLPRGRRLAASLTLGSSWGLAGLIVAGLQAYFSSLREFETIFWALLPFTLLAAVGALLLPRDAQRAEIAPISSYAPSVPTGAAIGAPADPARFP